MFLPIQFQYGHITIVRENLIDGDCEKFTRKLDKFFMSIYSGHCGEIITIPFYENRHLTNEQRTELGNIIYSDVKKFEVVITQEP